MPAHKSKPQQTNGARRLAPVAGPPPHTDPTELNLTVLRRLYPAVRAVVSMAHFAVLYSWAHAAEQWDRAGIDGPLFVCELEPGPAAAPRFAVVILNRRSPGDFWLELASAAHVDLDDDQYIILQCDQVDDDHIPKVMGLWVFSEPAPASTADARDIVGRAIKECAERVEASQSPYNKDAGFSGNGFASNGAQNNGMQSNGAQSNGAQSNRAHSNRAHSNGAGHGEAPTQPQPRSAQQNGLAMTRQLSLRELFGQPRDQSGSTADLSEQPQPPPAPSGRSWDPAPPPTGLSMIQNDMLSHMFAKARAENQRGR